MSVWRDARTRWQGRWARRADLPLLVEALFWLSAAATALRLLPFARVVALLRPSLSAAPATPAPIVTRVAWSVAAAARHAPWRAVCIHQAIAAQRMLARRGILAEAHYGVTRAPDGSFPAHVWLVAGGGIVTGGELAADYTTLARFAPGPSA